MTKEPLMLHDCTAYVLAGGQSARMGEDKALLSYRGDSLIQYPLRLFQQLTRTVRIIGHPDRYARFGLPVVADCVPSCGPLSGVYTALKDSSTLWNLFLACDMPLMRADFFQLLLSRRSGADAVVARFDDGFVEPLAAAYSLACLPAIAACFSQGRFKVSDFFSSITVAWVGEDDLRQQGLSRQIFTNVNTREEFRELVEGA